MDVARLKKEDYKLYMNIIYPVQSYIDQEKNYYGSFLIGPVDIGYGITLGNTLRRILLSNLSAFAITGLRINNLKHEFTFLEGVREDLLEIILNLKEIIFRSSYFSQKKNYKKFKGFLKTTGPCILTAGMFNLPKNLLKIINPHQYIGTLTTAEPFLLEIDIENGSGYTLGETKENFYNQHSLISKENTTIFLDTNFNPIKKVNYKIKLINDSQGILKETLFIEIMTNGSITPTRSLQESLKIIVTFFSSLLIKMNTSFSNKNFNI